MTLTATTSDPLTTDKGVRQALRACRSRDEWNKTISRIWAANRTDPDAAEWIRSIVLGGVIFQEVSATWP